MVTALEGRALCYAYRSGVRALRGVDVSVSHGEVLALLGPNGSGKSTLLRVMGGLLEPDSGQVELSGRPLRQIRARDRARSIARVPTDLLRWPELTVEEFVWGGRYCHEERFRGRRPADRAAVDRALAEAELTELGGRVVTELSSGQRQRALVARALAQEAEVLLVDEPTRSLDPEHQLSVFRWLKALAEQGRAVMVATHDLNLAGRYGSRLFVLNDGLCAVEGEPEQVMRPEILEPIYGAHLHFGAVSLHGVSHPFVLPWWYPERERS